ncbi:hypothetical protein JHK87_033532 [Glycine soja]|nr:hypothetical protein JHK87_033532 [Glycine soja]
MLDDSGPSPASNGDTTMATRPNTKPKDDEGSDNDGEGPRPSQRLEIIFADRKITGMCFSLLSSSLMLFAPSSTSSPRMDSKPRSFTYGSRFLINSIKFAHTNPLHLDVFKSVAHFEAEVVAMTAALLGSKEKNSGGQICGNMTPSGTEFPIPWLDKPLGHWMIHQEL